MPVSFKPTSTIEFGLGINKGGRVHKFLTDECARQMDEFVPMDTGALAETVVKGERINRANVKTGYITYSQPYASKVYYQIGISKYNTDKHPLAGPYWDRRMMSAKKQDIVRAVQKYLDRGGK